MTTTERVSWLGAGRMGEAMVERLLDGGVDVQVWNRTPQKLDGLVASGARRLDSLAQAGSAPVVFSMVLDDAALTALWQADGGVLSGPDLPEVWVDCSSVSPAASRAAEEAAQTEGVAFVSAPVSGNPATVRSGNLIFAASGPLQSIERVRPLLDVIGRGTHVIGEGHEARVVKLCTNVVLAVIAEALAESLVLAEGHGVRRGALMEFINDSAVGSPFTRYKTAAFVGLELQPAFTPEGQRKDLRLALALGAEKEVPLPVVSATEVEYSRLVASGLGKDRDFASLILRAARDAGMTIEPEPSTPKVTP